MLELSKALNTCTYDLVYSAVKKQAKIHIILAFHPTTKSCLIYYAPLCKMLLMEKVSNNDQRYHCGIVPYSTTNSSFWKKCLVEAFEAGCPRPFSKPYGHLKTIKRYLRQKKISAHFQSINVCFQKQSNACWPYFCSDKAAKLLTPFCSKKGQKNVQCQVPQHFLNASKYCGSVLRNNFVVVGVAVELLL